MVTSWCHDDYAHFLYTVHQENQLRQDCPIEEMVISSLLIKTLVYETPPGRHDYFRCCPNCEANTTIKQCTVNDKRTKQPEAERRSVFMEDQRGGCDVTCRCESGGRVLAERWTPERLCVKGLTFASSSGGGSLHSNSVSQHSNSRAGPAMR